MLRFQSSHERRPVSSKIRRLFFRGEEGQRVVKREMCILQQQRSLASCLLQNLPALSMDPRKDNSICTAIRHRMSPEPVEGRCELEGKGRSVSCCNGSPAGPVGVSRRDTGHPRLPQYIASPCCVCLSLGRGWLGHQERRVPLSYSHANSGLGIRTALLSQCIGDGTLCVSSPQAFSPKKLRFERKSLTP